MDTLNYTLIPIEGGYQKPKKATFVRQSATQIVVRMDGEMGVRKFDRTTMLQKGSTKNDFPRYRLEETSN